MTDIQTLKRILHKEEMKKPLPDFKVKPLEQLRKEINDIGEEYLPSNNIHLTDTEYKERYILPQLELERLDFHEAQLIKARQGLLLGALYIYLCLIALLGIYSWA